jgi:hypothetical protein
MMLDLAIVALLLLATAELLILWSRRAFRKRKRRVVFLNDPVEPIQTRRESVLNNPNVYRRMLNRRARRAFDAQKRQGATNEQALKTAAVRRTQ